MADEENIYQREDGTIHMVDPSDSYPHAHRIWNRDGELIYQREIYDTYDNPSYDILQDGPIGGTGFLNPLGD